MTHSATSPDMTMHTRCSPSGDGPCIAVYATDVAGRLIFHNPDTTALWADNPAFGETGWQSAWRLRDGEGKRIAHAHEIVGEGARNSLPANVIATDENRSFILARGGLQNAAGELVGAVNILTDITGCSHEERGEIDHRTSNLLATVQAIARMTRAETPPEFITAFSGRLAALARVHVHLAKSRWAGVDVSQLLEDELIPYRSGRGEGIRVGGPEIRVVADAGQALAMVFHELTINAAKYGALASPTGSLAVDWGWAAGDGFYLEWTEDGVTDCATPARKGFGSRLIEHSIAAQLSGTATFRWRPQGLACGITIPESKLIMPTIPGRRATAGVSAS